MYSEREVDVVRLSIYEAMMGRGIVKRSNMYRRR
jgi:hypothetical protein